MLLANMRFLLADDQRLLRDLMRYLLINEWPEAVIGDAYDVPSTLGELRRHQWDLLVLDISFPGRNAFDVLEYLQDDPAAPPVLMLSAHPEEHYAARAIAAGASGYITKDSATSELVNAVKTLLKGEKYITPRAAREIAESAATGQHLIKHKRLSNREFDVFLRLAAGHSVTQVAEELCLSVKTVSTHRTSILTKLELSSNAELMRYAADNGLHY